MKKEKNSMWKYLGTIIAGMIIEELLQRPIKSLVHFIKDTGKAIKKTICPQPTPIEGEAFIFNIKTNAIIIDGNGIKEIADQNIKVHVIESLPYELSEEMVSLVNTTTANLSRHQNNGETVPWDGKVLSLYKYNITRTADEEEPVIELSMAKCNYYTANPMIKNAHIDFLSKRIDDFLDNNCGGIYTIPNAFGICLCVVTEDNKVVFTVRSDNSGLRPGESDVSVVEGLNPYHDLNSGGLRAFSEICKRAIREEIGDIEDDKIEIHLLGLVFDRDYSQWNIVGKASIDMTQNEIIARRNTGALGKWELKKLEFVDYKISDTIEYLFKHEMWDMGIVTTYFTLAHKYSKDRIDKEINKRFKKFGF